MDEGPTESISCCLWYSLLFHLLGGFGRLRKALASHILTSLCADVSDASLKKSRMDDGAPFFLGVNVAKRLGVCQNTGTPKMGLHNRNTRILEEKGQA